MRPSSINRSNVKLASEAATANTAKPPVVNTERASAHYYIDVLTLVLDRLGWRNARGPPLPGTSVVWSEDPVRKPRLLALPHGARTNRFFAMVRVCRKVCLAICLDACEQLHPEAFARLAPRTWWVGRDAVGWKDQLAAHRAHAEASTEAAGEAVRSEEGALQAFIVKPDNGCQGAGIELVRGHAELLALLARADAPERAVVQEYLPNPLLVNGLKFDLRLYVVLTCASPLQAFLSTRGVARFASHPWRPVDPSNQSDLFMHLSNSSINQVASGVSNKWELPRLWAHLAEQGADIEALWQRIHRLVGLTLVAMQPTIAHAYSTAFSLQFGSGRRRGVSAAAALAGTDDEISPPSARLDARPEARRCFQVLGFDVMLDAELSPWLLEVNHSPSMALAGNEPLEVEAKCSVIKAALKLGLADEHPAALCTECEVEPLHDVSRPLCTLDAVRSVFETHATSTSAQQWTLNAAAFEKLMQPALALLTAGPYTGGAASPVGSSPGTASMDTASLGSGSRGVSPVNPAAVDLRGVFDAACAARSDVGSGWDTPAAGQMSLWAFTEAVLRLAELVDMNADVSPIYPMDVARATTARGGDGSRGLAAAVERLVGVITHR